MIDTPRFAQRLALAAALLSVACAQAQSTPGGERPRLLVVVSVDQLCQDYLVRFQDNFPADPKSSFFRRVLTQGAYFANCHHGHAYTVTAPGHAVQLTGAYPNGHGIIGNDWFDRATGKSRYCVADDTVEVLGIAAGKPMSPKSLLVPTVGDMLKLKTSGQGKVFGVAIKDRAAILMSGGRADTAFWMEKSQWVTSTYYRDDIPGYLRVLNNGPFLTRYHGQTWDLLLPREKYHNQGADDNPHENPPKGFTAAFPHKFAKAGELPLDQFDDQVLFSPFGNDVTLEAARELVLGEKLGGDEIPDLLTINLSSNDYVGHAFGPYSLEVEDMTYRTDRQLAGFCDFLDQTVGAGKWTLALTADHGVAPIPEMLEQVAGAGKQHTQAKRNPLGDLKAVRAALEAAIRARCGETNKKPVILSLTDNQVVLDRSHADLRGENFEVALRVVRDALLQYPLVAIVATREELAVGGGEAGLLGAMARTFHPQRSGDVLFFYAPYCIPGVAGGKPRGTTHGSPWHYDTHVPLLFLGAGIKPGRQERRVQVPALAATAAILLGVDAPGAAVEPPLVEVILPSNGF